MEAWHSRVVAGAEHQGEAARIAQYMMVDNKHAAVLRLSLFHWGMHLRALMDQH